MISGGDLSLLMWRCAYVYVCRKEAQLTEREVKVLLAMRSYFRADERPPQSLANRALGIVTLFKARREGLNRRLNVATKQKARMEAARIRAQRLKSNETTRQIAGNDSLSEEPPGCYKKL